MQRYISLAFLLIVSIVFSLHSTMDAWADLSPVLQGHSKRGNSSVARSAKKAKVATKSRIVTQKTRKKPSIAKIPQPTSKKKSGKRRHVLHKAAKPRSNTGSFKKPVVARIAKCSGPQKKRHNVRKSIASRKKARISAAKVPNSAGPSYRVSDIERLISSRCVMVMDADSGATIYAKSPDVPRQPASTIKIVTAMIAIKSLKNNESVSVSRRASEMPSSKIFLDPTQNYRANDLINAVLLASANDASVALAEKIAGTEAKFANLMTISAKMWGARNTRCRTASGLTAEGQHSTARDLANLFRYAMQQNEFAERIHAKKVRTSYGKTLRNHNKALWRVDGAVGGKTGYTAAARQTYVGQFTREGETIVVAIMGSETMWADLKKLVEYGFSKKKQKQLAQIAHKNTQRNATGIN